MPVVSCSRQKPVKFKDGEATKQMDSFDPASPITYACPAYVIKAEEFTYAKGTRKALKMIVDSDGYVTERVIWPDYNTGKLKQYPDLVKGAVCILFLMRSPNKVTTNVYDVVTLFSPLQNKKE